MSPVFAKVSVHHQAFAYWKSTYKAHELLPVSFWSFQNESLERDLKMSNQETKSSVITAKVIMIRFNKFSARALIANGFYFPDKIIYRLLRNFICVSFVKEHDRVFNLGPADSCFCNWHWLISSGILFCFFRN